MLTLSPEDWIKREILLSAFANGADPVPISTEEEIRDAYVELRDNGDGLIQDLLYEFREGKIETGLPGEWSRHYSSRAVAAKMTDGPWIGWTYWYGGGKHGDPGSIDWMDEAYFVTPEEVSRAKVVRFRNANGRIGKAVVLEG